MKTKLGILAFLFFYCAISVAAQQPPDTNPKPVPTPQTTKVVDTKFKLVTASLFASTVYDMETTFAAKRNCSACREGNPVMRPFINSGRPATYAFVFGLDSLVTYNAYEMKKHHKKAWWVGPVVATGIHAAAGTLNLRFVISFK